MPGITLPLPLVIGSDIAGQVVEPLDVTSTAVVYRVVIERLLRRWIDRRAVQRRSRRVSAAHASQLVPIPNSVTYESPRAFRLRTRPRTARR